MDGLSVLWFRAFHIIAMVAWFAALFYLPRLFVYHADAHDAVSYQRFVIMERRLYYAIMWPAAVLTTVFGLSMLIPGWALYRQMPWMHLKLTLVVLLFGFHFFCGHCVKQFARKRNQHSGRFYRIINEMPTLLLISIVILVEVQPQFGA